MNKTISIIAFTLLAATQTSFGLSELRPTADQQLARNIYQSFIEAKSGYTTGSTTLVVNEAVKYLKEAGFEDKDIFVGGAAPHKANLVVRYRGTQSKKPILLLAHSDVVEAKRSDWSMDPYQLTEKDGYFYGRGTFDDKAQAAIWLSTLIELKKEHFKPNRDIILAITADEEGGGKYNGVSWLLKYHKPLINGEFALNEGGFGEQLQGKPISQTIQVSEKILVNYTLTVKNHGGHSSIPVDKNAINQLAAAIEKIAEIHFPIQLNDTTKAYFSGLYEHHLLPKKLEKPFNDLIHHTDHYEQSAEIISKASPFFHSLLRTTCQPTLLAAGHAKNALPQLATANINCRIMPNESQSDVLAKLKNAINDPDVQIDSTALSSSSPSPINSSLFKAITETSEAYWPKTPVLPFMVPGATDGRKLRNAGIPTYGVSGLFIDTDDIRMHGKDERIRVSAFYQSQAFLYTLVKKLTS